MKKHLTKICMLIACSVIAGNAIAQGVGSAEATGGTIGTSALALASTDTTTSVGETLYIGPGTYQIDGTWNIYAKYVWISPDAVITGTGNMIFNNPAAAGGAASPTLIDGNNNPAYIGVNMVQNNPLNMVLTDIPGPDPSWTDNVGNANLTTSKDFKFNVANGDVLLGNYDMVTLNTATLSGYQPDRFAVTNGTGHLVHQFYLGNFVYPVGIAEGDYTPASISTTVNGNTFHVNAGTYAAAPAGSINAPQEGIGRLWNIYADDGVTPAAICLEHNLATNGANYNDAQTFVTQYVGTTPNSSGDLTSQSGWQYNTPGAGVTGTMVDPAGTVTGSSTRCRTYPALATTATANGAWFTKSSGLITPLPVVLEYFKGDAEGCNAALTWKTASEKNFSHFEVMRSIDGSHFENIATVAGAHAAEGHVYTYTVRQDAAVAYYKLKLVDLDGSTTFSSDIRRIANGCNKAGEGIVVYPNPANIGSEVTLKYEASNKGKGNLLLCDITGRVLYTEPVQVEAGANLFHIRVNMLSAGTYMLRLAPDSGTWNLSPVKLIIKDNH